MERVEQIRCVFLLLVQKTNRQMFWWGRFRQTVETFMLSLIVLQDDLLRRRRNSRLYLHTYQSRGVCGSFAFISSYFFIF